MTIIVNIDVMLAKRKMSVTELADKVGPACDVESARAVEFDGDCVEHRLQVVACSDRGADGQDEVLLAVLGEVGPKLLEHPRDRFIVEVHLRAAARVRNAYAA